MLISSDQILMFSIEKKCIYNAKIVQQLTAKYYIIKKRKV